MPEKSLKLTLINYIKKSNYKVKRKILNDYAINKDVIELLSSIRSNNYENDLSHVLLNTSIWSNNYKNDLGYVILSNINEVYKAPLYIK